MKIIPPPPIDKPWEELTDDDLFIGIEDGPVGRIDMTGEPWWKRAWFKFLRIT